VGQVLGPYGMVGIQASTRSERFLRIPYQQPAMKIRTENWEKVSPVCSLIFIGGGEAPLHDR